jgi:hypothetical protein
MGEANANALFNFATASTSVFRSKEIIEGYERAERFEDNLSKKLRAGRRWPELRLFSISAPHADCITKMPAVSRQIFVGRLLKLPRQTDRRQGLLELDHAEGRLNTRASL